MKLRAMFQAVIAALSLTDEQKTKADVAIGTIPDVEFDGDKKVEDKKPDESTKAENEALKAMLAKQNEALESLTKRFADQDAATTAKAKSDRDKSITDLVEAAKKDGRIPAQNAAEVERWSKLLNADFENGKAVLDAVPKTINSTKDDDSKTDAKAVRGVNPATGMDALREAATSAFAVN